MTTIEYLKKPQWIRVKSNSNVQFVRLKQLLNQQNLNTVCEEASCPNIYECFSKSIATFMIMGNRCTRSCPFCNVKHGRPYPINIDEPQKLAIIVAKLEIKHVVITSVNRDDLKDGGASHFVECIKKLRNLSPQTKIEILIPDFRRCLDEAINTLSMFPPDIMNHNLETIPRLYRRVRPGSNYQHSLLLLKNFKLLQPNIITKSGLMVGLGETFEEILQVMQDLRTHYVDMLTIGQYLQPSLNHLPVKEYVSLDFYKLYKNAAKKMGFSNVMVGPLVRSSYQADLQTQDYY